MVPGRSLSYSEPPEIPLKLTSLIPMLPVRGTPASVESYRKLCFGDVGLMLDESINTPADAEL
jgi:hypothetical protein